MYLNLLQAPSQVKNDKTAHFLQMGYGPLIIHDSKIEHPEWVYAIKNLQNGKLYIGRTSNIVGRAGTHIYHAENLTRIKPPPITRAMRKEGVQNFVMYPLAKVDGRERSSKIEIALIHHFNTLNPTIGYNIETNLDTYRNGGHFSGGTKHSIKTKLLKSKPILAIDPDAKQVYLAFGAKLFGDMLGISKDIIKNCLRRPCKCKSYHVYYTNTEDNERFYHARSERKRVGFSAINSNNTNEYLQFYPLVQEYARTSDPKIFESLGYTVQFITYNDDPNNSIQYRIYDIDYLSDYLFNLK